MNYNQKSDDCMIVALYNAAIAVGRKITYQHVYDVAANRGWYVPGAGFKMAFFEEALKTLKIKAEYVPTKPKSLFYSITKKKKVFLMTCPCIYDSTTPGHAMVATKSDKGAKVWNSYFSDYGWKTLSKNIRANRVQITAFEITRAK